MAYNVDDFNKILADINAKIDNLASDSEEKSVLIESMKNAFDHKSSVEIERLEEFSEDLNNIKSMLDNGVNAKDSGEITEALKNLEQSFKNEILNVTFDKERMLDGIKEEIVRMIEKSAYLDELYPGKNSEYFDDVKRTISDSLALVQNDINGHIKEDYEMLAQAIGALYGYLEKIKKDINTNSTGETAQMASDIRQALNTAVNTLTSKTDELTVLISSNSADRDAMSAVLNSAKSKVDEIETILKDNYSNQIDDLKMDLALLTDKVESASFDIKKSIGTDISTVLKGIEDSAALISEFKESVSSDLSGYLGSLKEALATFSDEMKSSQETFHSELFDRKSEEISQLVRDLDELDKNLLERDTDYKEFVSGKINAVFDTVKSLQEIISSSNTAYSDSLAEKMAVIEDLILKKSMLKDEKLDTLENTFNEYLNVIRENLNRFDVEFKTFDDSITAKVDSVSGILNNVSGKTDEIALNIRTNLSNQISDLKTDISVAGDKVDLLKDEMNRISTHSLSQVMTGLQNSSALIGDFKEDMVSHMSEYLTAIKDALATFADDMKVVEETFDSDAIEQKLTELQGLSQDIQKLDADLAYKETNYRGYVDEKIEELHNYLVTLEDMISSSGIGVENSVCAKISALEDLITGKDNAGTMGQISEKLDNVAGKTEEQSNNIKEIKELINSVFEEIQNKNDAVQSSISENDAHARLIEANFIEQLRELETKLQESGSKHRLDTYEKISEIEELLSLVKTSVENIGTNSLEKLETKLAEIELGLNENYSSYDENLTVLQNKIGEYITSSEKIAADTGSKIENSLVEIIEIKTELRDLYEKFDTLNVQNPDDTDNHFAEVIGKLEGVIEKLELSRTNLDESFKNSVQDSIEFVDKGLGYISSNLGEIKSGQSENLKNLTSVINEKIDEIKEQLSLINTDIVQAASGKTEALLESFSPLKDAMDKVLDFDFEKIIEEVKNQIQLSYLNLLSEINDNLTDNQDAYIKIENTYKDIVSRCASLEDYLNDFTQNNIELMSSTVANIDNNVKLNLDKTSEFYDRWNASIEEINNKLRENNKEFEHSLVDILEQMDRTLDEKLLLSQKDLQNYLVNLIEEQNFAQLIENANKELADKIEDLKFGITDGLETETLPEELADSVKKILQNSISVLNEKFDTFESKLDIISHPDNTEILDEITGTSERVMSSVNELAAKIDGLLAEDTGSSVKLINTNCEEIQKSISELHSKVDILAMTENEDESLDELFNSCQNIQKTLINLQEKIDASSGFANTTEGGNLSDFCKNIQKSVEELNSKVDILAMADNSELQEEISETSEKLEKSLQELHSKIDILAATGNSGNSEDISELSEKITKSVAELNSKVDVLVMSDDSELLNEVNEISDNLMKSLQELHSKFDILAVTDGSSSSGEISALSDNMMKALTELNSKVDILAMSDNSELQEEISDSSEKILDTINELHKKVDILAQEDNSAIQGDIEEIKELIKTGQTKSGISPDGEIAAKLDEILQTLDSSDDKISKTLELLHNKVDILASADDSDIREEIQSIKDLIETQKEAFESDTGDAKSQEISSHLQKLIGEINKIEKNVSELDLEKNSRDIKDSVMTAILSAMDQVSFVEETEEIKDFVEEKTNAINQTLLDVKRQLNSISNSGGDMDFYSYTLQDVESDFAKLRLTLNEISASASSSNEFGVISANINRMAKTLEQLQINLAARNNSAPDLKADFDKLSEDILSLSARTNKILLNSTESQRIMSLSLEDFSRRSTQLENRLNELDNKQIDSRLSLIEGKIDETVSSGKVLQNVMMYLGEWMDGTSETISSIYDKSLKAASVPELLENLKLSVPEQTDLLKVVEDKFEEQQSRIDRLEQKLEKALEMLSDYDENIITAKIDRLDKQLAKLSENIEKLTAYVDEE